MLLRLSWRRQSPVVITKVQAPSPWCAPPVVIQKKKKRRQCEALHRLHSTQQRGSQGRSPNYEHGTYITPRTSEVLFLQTRCTLPILQNQSGPKVAWRITAKQFSGPFSGMKGSLPSMINIHYKYRNKYIYMFPAISICQSKKKEHRKNKYTFVSRPCSQRLSNLFRQCLLLYKVLMPNYFIKRSIQKVLRELGQELKDGG